MVNRYPRRSLLKGISAIGLAAVLPRHTYSQDAAGSILTRPIPGTDEMLPLVGLGSSATVTDILKNGPTAVTRLIETMVRLGASVIDTAPREVAIDELFGKVISDPRFKSRLFVNTKIGRNRALNLRTLDKQAGIDQILQTERLFKRKPADLILVDSMIDMDVHWPSLREAKANGNARYIGYTTSNTVDHARMEAYMQDSPPDFIQVNYSLLEPEIEERILPLARDKGIAVMINTPFAGGEYFKLVQGLALPEWAAEFDCTSWAQFNLKYILSEPAVNCVLTETTKVGNLEENLRTATGELPDTGTRTKMKAYFASMVRK